MFVIILLSVVLFNVALFGAIDIQDNEVLQPDLVDLSQYGSSVFGKPSSESGKKLEQWSEEKSQVNPEELGVYLEGDILFPMDSRNGLIAQTFRWKDNLVPYEIHGQFTQKDLNMISDAMDQYHMHTCIKFRPRNSSQQDYISIVGGNTGCWSSVGRVGGRQEVNLQSPGCLTRVGTAIHELMHSVGFMHEQNRYERDDHVSIIWSNIQKGRETNFKKAEKDQASGFGVSYDYGSVMHYSNHAFAINAQNPTIVAKNASNDHVMGQRNGFSPGDIAKIRKMYNCQEREQVDENDNKVSSESGIGNIWSIFGK